MYALAEQAEIETPERRERPAEDGLRDPLEETDSGDPLGGLTLADPLATPPDAPEPPEPNAGAGPAAPIQLTGEDGDADGDGGGGEDEEPDSGEPLPQAFYDEIIEATTEAQELRQIAVDLRASVEGTAAMYLTDAVDLIDQADHDLDSAVQDAEANAESTEGGSADEAHQAAASDALAEVLAATELARDIIEPTQDLARAVIFRVFADINRGLGRQAGQLMTDIREAQARVQSLQEQADRATQEMGEAFGQFGLDLALNGVNLALSAMCPPLGAATSILTAGGAMVWDRLLGPQSGSFTDMATSDPNSATAGASAGVGYFAREGSRLARASARLGQATILVGTFIDGMEVADAIERYETLPGLLREERNTLDDLLRRYQALGPFVEGWQTAEARARVLEAAASRLEGSAASRGR